MSVTAVCTAYSLYGIPKTVFTKRYKNFCFHKTLSHHENSFCLLFSSKACLIIRLCSDPVEIKVNCWFVTVKLQCTTHWNYNCEPLRDIHCPLWESVHLERKHYKYVVYRSKVCGISGYPESLLRSIFLFSYKPRLTYQSCSEYWVSAWNAGSVSD